MDMKDNAALESTIDTHLTLNHSGFGELPIEIFLEILSLAGSQSQATYLALLLASKLFNELVRAECIPFLRIVLSRSAQFPNFNVWLRRYPNLASRVRYLWVVPDSPMSEAEILLAIASCPNIVSLACGIRELQFWVALSIRSRKNPELWLSSLHFELALPSSLKHITVMVNNPTLLLEPLNEILSQVQTLHVIGCGDSSIEFPPSVLLQANYSNLTDASFSFPQGVNPNCNRFLSGTFLQSPKLANVAFILRTMPETDSEMTPSVIRCLLGPRFSLLLRSKRWTETKMWKENIMDKRCPWKLRRYESEVEVHS